MGQRSIQLRDLSAVASGKTTLINLPIGPRYLKVALVFGDTAAGNGNAPAASAVINEVRCNYLGGIQRRCLASRMDNIYTDYGSQFGVQTHTSGGANGTGRSVLPIYFHEPWRKRSLDADALAWQTAFFGKGDVFIIEVDLVGGAVVPALTAYALVDDFAGASGPHKIMKWDTMDAPAVGTPISYTKLDKKDAYSQLSIFDTSDGKTIDNVRLVQGSRELHNLSKQENIAELKHEDMTQAAGRYHIVFDKDDDLRNVQPAQGMELIATPNAAAAGTMSIIGQRFGLPE